MSNPLRVFVSSGEPSGDLHAARVVRHLTSRCPDISLTGIGGEQMAEAGVRLTHSIEHLGAVGFVEVITSLPRHARFLRKASRDFVTTPYRLAVVVDYPGFHLRLARIAARRGVPVLYYIPPQLWAWGAWRATTIRETVRHVASILPFERDFFAQMGIPTTFVGHPLLDRRPLARSDARARLDIPTDTPILALFPGSRRSEVARMWPAFRAAALRVREAIPNVEVLVASVPGERYPTSQSFRLIPAQSDVVMSAADVALCKSGTTTLEAALAGTPCCIAYRVHPLTYTLARRLSRCSHIGLVNLLLRRPAIPEFIQDHATAAEMAATLLPLFDRQGSAVTTQLEAFAEARDMLGAPGVASRVADLAMELAT